MGKVGLGVCLAEDFFKCGPHNLGVWVDTGPMTDSDYSLIHEHTESVDNLATFPPGITHEVGRRWVGITPATTVSELRLSRSKSRRASTPGKSPIEVALIKTPVPAGRTKVLSQSTKLA